MKQHTKRQYYCMYTIAFALASLLIFGRYLLSGKTLIWQNDGFIQHYKAYVYYGKALRDIVRHLLTDHTLQIPAFSFSLGYGSDVIGTLNYYVIGDPLTLLSALVPTRYMPQFYGILILVRFYLIGLTFSAYSLYMKDHSEQPDLKNTLSSYGILAGALVYTFCGFALYGGVRHPYFLNPMIYLPLVLLGVEKILDKKKPFLFSIGVFLSAVSNFYFFYMTVILTVLYVLWKLIIRYSENGMKKTLGLLSRIAMYSLLGTLMSSLIFLPAVLGFLNSSRTASGYVYDFFYSLGDYENNIGSFISFSPSTNYWTFLGYSSIALIALVILFLQKKHRSTKIVFLLVTLMVLLPVMGHVMNGFSYVTNRWIWGYSFLIAYIISLTWKNLFTLSEKKKLILWGCLTVYFLLCVLLFKSRTIGAMFGMAAAFLMLSLVNMAGKNLRNSLIEGLLILCILGNIAGTAFFKFSPREGAYLKDFPSYQEIQDRLAGTEAAEITSVSTNEKDFFRYTGYLTTKNDTLLSGLHSTQYYWSLENGNISRFRSELALSDEISAYDYKTLDSRTILSTLANVRYAIQDELIPFGYQKQEGYLPYSLWKNEYALPFGYTYENAISRSTYEELTPVQKQEALLQGCVIDDDKLSGEAYQPSSESQTLEYTISAGDGITLKEHSFVVTDTQATVKLTFKGMEKAETYLYLTGLNYTGSSPMDSYTEEEYNRLSPYDKQELRFSDRYYTEPQNFNLTLLSKDDSGAETRKVLTYFTPTYTWYGNRHDFMTNFGYHEDAQTSVFLKFPVPGEYSFDSIEVLCQPLKSYPEEIEKLSQDTLQQVDFHENPVTFSTRQITGEITLDRAKYLLLTIPYTKGWTATVDGKPQELLQANTMYMALDLDAGEHEIELRYETPGLTAGLIISLFSFLIFFILVGFYRRR
ncbi:MAG: YfhO family protein [Eubacteriales bacterium]|nr:YfhO family protein [Eubacteriales bacterium]